MTKEEFEALEKEVHRLRIAVFDSLSFDSMNKAADISTAGVAKTILSEAKTIVASADSIASACTELCDTVVVDVDKLNSSTVLRSDVLFDFLIKTHELKSAKIRKELEQAKAFYQHAVRKK